jgi:uncharacterized protein involved in response to NO
VRPPDRFALWALGFRPFYLLAASFAALSVALWVLQYSGFVQAGVLRGAAWHGHEMIFGYAFAVVAGFLLTAVRNWTQRDTPTGAWLAALVLLWVAGRILVMTPFALAAALVNAAFPLAVAVAIGVPLVASGNRRNYFFMALLAGAGVAVLLFHLSNMGAVEWPARIGLQAGLDLMLFIIAVVAGRVIPMFTNNGVPGAGAWRTPWLEKISLGSVLLLLAFDIAGIGGWPLVMLALAAALVHGSRLAFWHPWRTLKTPLVWVLHASYAWIPVHLVLRAAAEGQLVAAPLAVHALTIGAIGGMTVGMMTRTARGHSGRPLVADRAEVACYALVQAAAIVRVVGGLAIPAAYLQAVWISAGLWSAAFALYVVRYWPVLTRARIDGKPG